MKTKKAAEGPAQERRPQPPIGQNQSTVQSHNQTSKGWAPPDRQPGQRRNRYKFYQRRRTAAMSGNDALGVGRRPTGHTQQRSTQTDRTTKKTIAAKTSARHQRRIRGMPSCTGRFLEGEQMELPAHPEETSKCNLCVTTLSPSSLFPSPHLQISPGRAAGSSCSSWKNIQV